MSIPKKPTELRAELPMAWLTGWLAGWQLIARTLQINKKRSPSYRKRTFFFCRPEYDSGQNWSV
jgi:hypothetical protein